MGDCLRTASRTPGVANDMDANLLSAVFTALAFLFSLFSFYKVTSFNRNQMRSSAYSAIMERLFEINILEVGTPLLFEKLYENFNENALDEKGLGLRHYLFMVFNLYAEVYIQYT